ncbi:hypothetical protein VCRA2128O98_420054 [Vibrio crassostreae]|nr:hypothetical protein VCRA2128O100_100054 [Vibrio crassostreae]CAK3220509.1 hypothetical protein VCRA2128O109_100096 [Vibrio crassostreae]CAK3923964.1 hypothetical protein VCRA2128O98_420054 [Vibrio crassostreae]
MRPSFKDHKRVNDAIITRKLGLKLASNTSNEQKGLANARP